MKTELAIEILKELWRYEHTDKYTEAETREALDMAINTLSEHLDAENNDNSNRKEIENILEVVLNHTVLLNDIKIMLNPTSVLEDKYGYCEPYSKKIVIDANIGKDESIDWADGINLFENKVVRHEIIHAFFTESGLNSESEYAVNEELIDWLAYQIPKMQKLFRKLGIEE